MISSLLCSASDITQTVTDLGIKQRCSPFYVCRQLDNVENVRFWTRFAAYIYFAVHNIASYYFTAGSIFDFTLNFIKFFFFSPIVQSSRNIKRINNYLIFLFTFAKSDNFLRKSFDNATINSNLQQQAFHLTANSTNTIQ